MMYCSMRLLKGPLAMLLPKSGQPQEAYEYYQRAFKTNENKFSTPKYLFKAAIDRSGVGKTTQALEYFKRIKEGFSYS